MIQPVIIHRLQKVCNVHADDLAIMHADGDWQVVEGVLSKDMATTGHAIHCFSALNLGAGVEQPFNCLIIQKRHSMHSMGGRWIGHLENNMASPGSPLSSLERVVAVHCLAALYLGRVLGRRRGGHTPFVQAGAETPETCAEAVKPDPRFSW